MDTVLSFIEEHPIIAAIILLGLIKSIFEPIASVLKTYRKAKVLEKTIDNGYESGQLDDMIYHKKMISTTERPEPPCNDGKVIDITKYKKVTQNHSSRGHK